jgi:hypothetical protein
MTILKNPPPVIGPNYCNVGKVIVIHERGDRLDGRLEGRMALRDLTDEMYQVGSVVLAVVSLIRLTAIPSEIGELLDNLPPTWSMGFGMDDSMDMDGGDLATEDPSLGPAETQQGVREWHGPLDSSSPKVNRHMRHFSSMRSQLQLYRAEHDLMHKVVRGSADLHPEIVQAFETFAQTNGQTAFYCLTRISNVSESRQREHASAILRQQEFLLKFLPNTASTLEFAYTSVSRGSSPILDRLATLENCVIAITNIHRIARTPAAIEELRLLCTARNISVVCCLWEWSHLAAISSASILLPETRSRLANALHVGKQAKSVVMFWPTVALGRNVGHLVAQSVDTKIVQAMEFIKGKSTTGYQGELGYQDWDKDATGTTGKQAQARMVEQVAAALPANLQLDVVYRTGKKAYRCDCVKGQCAEDCTCQCPRCNDNYVRAVGHRVNEAACHSFCPCKKVTVQEQLEPDVMHSQ